MDPASLWAGAIVLLWILGFMANRIFSIDALAVRRWKEDKVEEKQREVQDARVRLIKAWEADEAGGPPPTPDGKP
ncbi:hypothetical protein FOA52_011779 [Chlamydomonas sp. UWO 241]|nr:hypothetical protein FOA52_011779 [Chlamydomonas sp. UWO 241]